MRCVKPQPSADYADGLHFSPLGNPAPLFTNPKRKSSEQRLASEIRVPGPIRPLAFFQNPQAYYGCDSDMSLAIYRGTMADPDSLIPLDAVFCKDLSRWSPPPSGMVAIDVALGRLAFAPGEMPSDLRVDYHYGFSADIGSGPYDRRSSLAKANLDDWEVIVAKVQPDPLPPQWRTSIGAAIDDWNPERQPRAVITIVDNDTYDEVLTLNLDNNQHLIVQADNLNRPVVRLRGTDVPSVLGVTGGAGQEATLTLNGLVVAGVIDYRCIATARANEGTHRYRHHHRPARRPG